MQPRRRHNGVLKMYHFPMGSKGLNSVLRGVFAAGAIAALTCLGAANRHSHKWRSPVIGFVAGYSDPTFAYNDGSGSGNLLIYPRNSFTGTVSISISRAIASGQGYNPIPGTVTIHAPSSASIMGTSTVSVPISFTWTSWPIGNYEAIATLSANGAATFHAPLLVAVKSTHAMVLTWHNDGLRTGQNPLETALSLATVGSSHFGKLFSHTLDGPIEAQPLYVPSVFVNGAFHDVVYVATMNDKVYAFDANSASGVNASPLWTADVGPVAPAGNGGGGDQYNQGEVSTPVIDLATNSIYCLTKNTDVNGSYNLLHALDLSTGHEKAPGPVRINATINGTVGGVNGQVIFQPLEQYQRCGLLLLNGVVYVAFGGLDGDPGPCRGWVMGYNAKTLAQTCSFNTTPDAGQGSQTAFAGGGIWMSGAGPATDGTYLYVATGNGDFDANQTGGKDYGDTVIKLLPHGTALQVADYFTPFDQQSLNDQDLDLGSSNPMLLPQTGTLPLLLQLGKDGTVYILNRRNMGKFNASSDHVVQEFASNTGGFHVTPVYYNNAVYFSSDGGPLNGYAVTNSGLGSSPFGTSPESFDEASPSVSYNNKLANPAASAIIWIVEHGNNAVLHAYAASNLSEIYSSGNNSADTAGSYMKFGTPTVANGKVYLGCDGELDVYGLH